MSDWDLKEETITARQWVRSWRQEFFTDFGQDFRMVAHMEQVTLLPDGTTAKKQLPAVTRDITQVGADPRVQQLHAILTELINEWRLEDMSKQEKAEKQAEAQVGSHVRIAELEAPASAPSAQP